MELKLKSFVLWPVVLLLIVGSWAGNVWYYQSMQLAEPLFLKHYITVNGNQGEIIDLTFLENKNEAKKVTGIQIEEIPELRFQIHEKNSYTHQVEMMASAEWIPNESQPQSKEPFTIREVTVYYNEGQPQKVPIGEINVEWPKVSGLLDFRSGGGSSNGSGSYKVNLTKSVTLEKIDYSYSDKLKPWFELELSGQPVDSLSFPMKLSQGKDLEFTYQWSIPEHEPDALQVYKSKIILTFRMADGRIIMENLPINHNLYLSDSQLKKLVRSGGEQQ
ncbi:MAG: hypothetical protein ACQEXQ_26490 [Bacillota bacterium]